MDDTKGLPIKEQLTLPYIWVKTPAAELRDEAAYLTRLTELLTGDLDFHQCNTAYASHGIHAFPAKFPPQLPRILIENL